MRRAVLDAGVDELLLESGDQSQSRRGFECGERATQELARAAFPWRAVGVAQVAEKEMFRCGTVGEIDTYLGGGVGHDHQVAAGAERGIEDRSESGLHQVGVRPTDTLAPARMNFLRRKPLAADVSRDVAGTDENQFLAQHQGLMGRAEGQRDLRIEP